MNYFLITILLVTLFPNWKIQAQPNWNTQFLSDTLGVTSVYFLNENTGWISASRQYSYPQVVWIGKTTNGGENWSFTATSESQIINNIFFVNESIGWAAVTVDVGANGTGLKLIKSTDGGASWNYLPSSAGFYAKASSIFALNKDTVFVTTGTGFDCCLRGEILRSFNGGTNFTAYYYPYDQFFYKIQFTNSTIGWVNAYRSNPNRNFILKTTNTGLNWTQLTINGDSTTAISDFSFINNSTGFIIRKDTLRKTTNGGLNWNFMSGMGGTLPTIMQMINETTGWMTRYIEPAGMKIFKTTSGGTNWFHNLLPPSPYRAGYPMMQFINENTGWIVSYSGSNPMKSIIMKTTNGGVVTGFTQTSSKLPDNFSISQNYPNPFNPSTTINYELPITNYVTIKIYDVLGNEIETLVNEKQNAGSYSVDFNASSLPSGVYFYKLVTDRFSETKKMILVK